MRIGFLYHENGKGLEVESREFVEHFKPQKILKIDNRKERITIEQYDEFLRDIDIFFCIETPYLWEAFKMARERGIKTILRVNYEWLPESISIKPDLFISPSLWHYDDIPEPKVYLPFPINRKRLPFKLRRKAKKFFHLGAAVSGYDRNGTEVLKEAIKKVKSKVEIKIEKAGQYKNYWDTWDNNEADVFILPRRYGGQSLSLNEAMSKGMAIISTDMKPQNEFLPKELLVPVKMKGIEIKRLVEVSDINPQDLASKIDEIANTDITKYSKISNQIAEKWSWKNLLPKYNQTFQNL